MTIWHPLIDPNQKGATTDSNLEDMEVIRKLSGKDRQKAMQEMVLANVPLVMYKVESYIALYPGLDFLYDDLVSAGILDLTESIERLANVLQTPEGGGNPTGYISQRVNWAIGEVVENDTKNEIPDNYSPPSRLKIDPTAIVDTRDLLESVCQTREDMIIMEMRERGSTDQEVADRLGIARSSVRVQRHELMQRYDTLVQETL